MMKNILRFVVVGLAMSVGVYAQAGKVDSETISGLGA